MTFISRSTVFSVLLTLAVSAAGGAVANAFGLPAGWLMGGAMAVTLAAMAGLPVSMPTRLRDVAFVLVGMSMGTAVARDSLGMIVQWPVSIAGLVLELALIIWLTGLILVKVFKLDAGTAFLSSFPGHLSFVMGLAAAGLGEPRQIVIIQAVRILMLTIVVPVGALFLPVEHFIPALHPTQLQWWQVLGLAAACATTGLIFSRLGLPAGFVLGSMAAAAVAKLTGLHNATMPPLLVTITFIMTGALIGSRFRGITGREFITAAKGGLIATGLAAAIVTVIAWAISLVIDMPFGQIWVGLAPGGLESMGALGLALGYDTAFIAGHHVMRLLLLGFAIPLVVMLIRRREKATIAEENGQKE